MNIGDGLNDISGRARGPGTDRGSADEYLAESRRYTWLAAVPMALLVIGAGALVWTSLDRGDNAIETNPGETLQSESIADGDDVVAEGDSGTAESDNAAGADDSDDVASPSASIVVADDSEENASATVASGLPSLPTDAPFVDATLTNNLFVLTGVVPDEQTKQLLEGKAELAYAPFFSSELTVDESIAPADWLVAAPEVVGLLPMITDGTIRLQDNAVTLVGRSPNPEYAALFEGAVGQLTGLPVSSEGIEITGLAPPRFIARVTETEVTLEGEVPSQLIAESFLQGAAAVYGPERVTSTITVDEGTYTSFWNYTMPGVFQLLQAFPAYEIRVIEGVTSGTMQGGVLFPQNSSEIAPEMAEVLSVVVALLTRDRSLDMTVVGHTDNRGPIELNQRLSLERAQSVVDFLASNGVDPTRLVAEGRGPDEPIATNDTLEGRALNRRVEVQFD